MGYHLTFAIVSVIMFIAFILLRGKRAD